MLARMWRLVIESIGASARFRPGPRARGRWTCLVASVIALPLTPKRAPAQEPTPIESRAIAPNVTLIRASGANVVLAETRRGAILVDAALPATRQALDSAVRAVTSRPVRYVLNTHYHFDHTGGNPWWSERGAAIIAHRGVKPRLERPQFIEIFDQRFPATPAWSPSLTFADSIRLELGDESILAFHVDSAHTDGDAIVVLERARVVVAGDAFIPGVYPFFDARAGGTIDGMIDVLDRILAVATDSTVIVPGHGPPVGRAEVADARRRLAGVRDTVAALVARGSTGEEAVAARPSAAYDAASEGYLEPDVFVRLVYETLRRHDRPATHSEVGTLMGESGPLGYRVEGSGPPVVLIHGEYLDHRMWDRQAAELARRHTVIRYDLRPYGSSAPAAGRSPVDDLRELLDALEVPRAAFVGLSLGGAVAVDFALAHPGMVERLVVAAPTVSGMPSPGGRRSEGERIAAALARGDTAAAVEAWGASPSLRPAMRRPAIAQLLRRWVAENAAGITQGYPRIDGDAYQRLNQLTVPVLVVVGDLESREVRELAERIDRLAPESRMVTIRGAGRMVNLEEPQQFGELVTRFLRR